MYVDSLGYVYVCESYIDLDESHSLFVFPVCAYDGVIGCFRYLCEFCFLCCDDVWLGAVYEFF